MTDPISQLSTVPFLRKLWVVVLLTCLLITFPLAMVVLLSGPVYRWRAPSWQPIGNGARYTYGGLLALWLVAATARVVLQPGGISGEWARSADPNTAKTPVATSQQQPTGAESPVPKILVDSNILAACTDPEVIQAVQNIIKERSTDPNTTVEDFGKASETVFDKPKNARRCSAEAVLSNGITRVTYQVFLGPSGKQIVQAQDGPGADHQYSIDISRKEELERAALADARGAVASKVAERFGADRETDTDVRDQYSSTYLDCMSGGDAGQGQSSAMIRCIDAEIDFQNSRMKEQFQSGVAAANNASDYRDKEMTWGERMTAGCAALRKSGDPVAEPHCVLNNTIRHLRKM